MTFHIPNSSNIDCMLVYIGLGMVFLYFKLKAIYANAAKGFFDWYSLYRYMLINLSTSIWLILLRISPWYQQLSEDVFGSSYYYHMDIIMAFLIVSVNILLVDNMENTGQLQELFGRYGIYPKKRAIRPVPATLLGRIYQGYFDNPD